MEGNRGMTTGMIRAAAAALALAIGASTAAAQAPVGEAQVERRYNVRVFSNVLVSAAQHGAELLGFRVQQIDPSIILLSGNAPRAEGFVIDGHGVFFHVEIPSIDPVVAWAVRTRGRDEAADNAIANLRSFVQTVSDSSAKTRLQRDVRSLEQRLSPPGASQPAREQTMGMAPSPAAAEPPPMDDPNQEYRQLVTRQLVNAMLDHSHQLGLAADEWLTIAARGDQGPLMAQAVFDNRVTLQLRVKGSDLADFRAGRLTREEARARVVIREN